MALSGEGDEGAERLKLVQMILKSFAECLFFREESAMMQPALLHRGKVEGSDSGQGLFCFQDLKLLIPI